MAPAGGIRNWAMFSPPAEDSYIFFSSYLFPSFLPPSSLPLSSPLSSPAVCCKLQIAMENSRLQWVAPGLNRGAPEPSGQRRTSPAGKKIPEGILEKNINKYMSEKNVKKYVWKNTRKNIINYVRKEIL